MVFPEGGPKDLSKYKQVGVGGWGWTKGFAQQKAKEWGHPFYYVKDAGPIGNFVRAATWKFFPGAPARELLGHLSKLPAGARVAFWSEGTILGAGALEMARPGGLSGLNIYSLGSAISETRIGEAATRAGATLAGYIADPLDANTMVTSLNPARILGAGVGSIVTGDRAHDFDQQMRRVGLRPVSLPDDRP